MGCHSYLGSMRKAKRRIAECLFINGSSSRPAANVDSIRLKEQSHPLASNSGMTRHQTACVRSWGGAIPLSTHCFRVPLCVPRNFLIQYIMFKTVHMLIPKKLGQTSITCIFIYRRYTVVYILCLFYLYFVIFVY
jgi:hypothetical protein